MNPVSIRFEDKSTLDYLTEEPLGAVILDAEDIAERYHTHVKCIKYQPQRRHNRHENL